MSDILNTFFNPVLWAIAIAIASLVVVLEWRSTIQERAKLFFDLSWIKPAITSSTHTLTHKGGISKYYFNLDYLSTTPEQVTSITNWYIETINKISSTEAVDGLVFIDKDSGPVGAISLMGSIIAETGIPSLIARLKKRTLHARITGRPELIKKLSLGINVIIITDAITTTRTVKDTVEVVNSFGGKVVGICTLLDRQTEHAGFVDNIPVYQRVTEDELVASGYVKEGAVY